MDITDRFCPECGAVQNAQPENASGSFCPNCGQPISKNELFCANCGARMESAPQPTADTNAGYTQKKSNNNTAIIIAAVAVLLAVLIATILIIANLNKPSNVTDATVSIDNIVEKTSTPVPTAPPEPIFTWITASSTRGYDTDSATGEIVHYYPEYATDGDMRTAWTPDRSLGLQPNITLHADKLQHVSGIRMTNGYCKSEKTYTKNRRITRVLVEYNGGSTTAAFDIDNYRQMLDIPFDKPADTDYISITVLETYAGEWKDIAISEIAPY